MPAIEKKVLIIAVCCLHAAASVAQTSGTKSSKSPAKANAAELAQMADQLRQSPRDDALRERLIRYARTMSPPPKPPEEARRWFVRGNVALADAHEKADYAHAASLFEQAVSNAPWWSDAYAALAKADESSENFDGAIRALRSFAIATTSEKDAREAEDRSYALEEKRDRQAKRDEAQRRDQEARARAAAEEDRRRRGNEAAIRAVRDRVEGATYTRWICYTRMIDQGDHSTADGCSIAEYGAKNWHSWGSGPIERFDFSEPGAIRVVFISAFPNPSSISLEGRPNGSSTADITWRCPILHWDNGKTTISGWRDAWVRYEPDGSSITYTCDTPRPSSNPTTKYQYTWFRRN